MSDKQAKARFWHLFSKNEPRASGDEQSQRLAICLTCPQFIHISKQCMKCGCFMPAKTRLEKASCPLGKW